MELSLTIIGLDCIESIFGQLRETDLLLGAKFTNHLEVLSIVILSQTDACCEYEYEMSDMCMYKQYDHMYT